MNENYILYMLRVLEKLKTFGYPGLERGEQGQPCEFNVWTREAGAGSLAISVEGPSKAEIDFKDRKDGSCYVSYVVTEPGKCFSELFQFLLATHLQIIPL